MTLAGVGALLLWDARPALFPAHAHALLGAFPLAMIAVAYLAYQAVQRPPLREWVKAVLLAAAFLFWAANQSCQMRARRWCATILRSRCSCWTSFC